MHTERPLTYAYRVPPECRLTNNGAELYAVYFVLTDIIPILNHDKSLIVTTSEFVFKGALGGAQKWRRHGWRGASGLVAGSGLWSKVLALIECVRVDLKWLNVPSHVGICGNEKANTLAEQGRQKNSLCPFPDSSLGECVVRAVDLDGTPLPVTSPGFPFTSESPANVVRRSFHFASRGDSCVCRQLQFDALVDSPMHSVVRNEDAELSLQKVDGSGECSEQEMLCANDGPTSPHDATCTPERSSIPVYMVDTPFADDFSMNSCSDSDTESLRSATSCISISSG